MKIVFAILLLLATLSLWGYCGVGDFFLCRDTDAVLVRAQVAANADDMQNYVETLQHNMEEREMTYGHAAVIFKTPANDMSLIYASVVRINERLIAIKDLDQTSTTYQVALDDLRGTLRELDLNTSSWFWARLGWWMTLISIFTLIGCIGFFIDY